ncbi:MAG: HlyD family efflux transporter periplasmic adaptor subunit [Verrucomicrobiales bacterium]|nr:HlyD family efflux transporter periplasmic adaptor subunit [Verrucomicrobiales bacterium]
MTPLATAPAPTDVAGQPAPSPVFPRRRLWWGVAAVTVAVGVAIALWMTRKPAWPGPGFVHGNGRVEATEIDVAARLGGRVSEIMVNEGDFVEAGQPLAQMQVEMLDAQRAEARAQSRQAGHAVTSAEAEVVARQGDTSAARALAGQRRSELDAAEKRLARTETLTRDGVKSRQELDDDRATVRGAEAALLGAEARVSAAQAAIQAAQSQVIGAGSGLAVTEASIARVEADITDTLLRSPRSGRVQYRIAQPGEVIPSGGKVLNLVDLGDVYMTFFLPETVVGKLALGSDVRIVLDAAPEYVIPAKLTYISSTAQFTPKAVETASERQKLMFRVKAQIDPDLLRKHQTLVKTGVPGVAWVKLEASADWPAKLELSIAK